jgi:hypothetical protein
MDYDRMLNTSVIVKRLAGLANRRRKCDLVARTPPAAAGSIAVMPVARRTIRNRHVIRSLVDVSFEESSELMEVTARLDESHLCDQVDRVHQLFERHVSKLELSDN